MAVNYWLNASNTEVAQVWKGTITTTTNGHTYIITLTMADGSTVAITYVVANPPDTTTTLVATGFINAWNASTHPAIARMTASQNAGQVILTSKTAGIPFTVAESGTGTWSGTGNTTSNVGNNDYGTAQNWSLNAVPVAADNVVISGPAGGGQSIAIKYSLNQSAVSIGSFTVAQSYTGDIGRIEDGRVFYLRIAPTTVDYNSSSNFAAIDIGSANISPQIACYGSPQSGRYVLYFKGSNVATFEVKKGKVAIAPQVGETATVATVLCSYIQNAQSDVDLTIASGVTLTTLTQSGGKCLLQCAATTVTVAADGTLTTDGSGAITTLNMNGQAFPNATGTITTINLYAGVLDFRRYRSSRTVTTLNILPRQDQGPKIYSHTAITYTNAPVQPTQTGTYTWYQVG